MMPSAGNLRDGHAIKRLDEARSRLIFNVAMTQRSPLAHSPRVQATHFRHTADAPESATAIC
jgi:hypothetical protein